MKINQTGMQELLYNKQVENIKIVYISMGLPHRLSLHCIASDGHLVHGAPARFTTSAGSLAINKNIKYSMWLYIVLIAVLINVNESLSTAYVLINVISEN